MQVVIRLPQNVVKDSRLLGEQPASGPAPWKERLGDVAGVGSRPMSPRLSPLSLGSGADLPNSVLCAALSVLFPWVSVASRPS